VKVPDAGSFSGVALALDMQQSGAEPALQPAVLENVGALLSGGRASVKGQLNV
jgi:hypothetical protein